MKKAALFFAISLCAVLARAQSSVVLNIGDTPVRPLPQLRPEYPRSQYTCENYKRLRAKVIKDLIPYCESAAEYRAQDDCNIVRLCKTKHTYCDAETPEMTKGCAFYKQQKKAKKKLCEIKNLDEVNPVFYSRIGSTNIQTFTAEDEQFFRANCPQAKPPEPPKKHHVLAPSQDPRWVGKKTNLKGTSCLDVQCKSGT